MTKQIWLLGIWAMGCAATSEDWEDDPSPEPTLQFDSGWTTTDAKPASSKDASPGLSIDAGSSGCVPGEVVGTAHVTNTCYLDCLNACIWCETPTGDATCDQYNHSGHDPYCPNMKIIGCPAGTHSERSYMNTASQYFPGTGHYADETFSCICDEHEGGVAR